MTVEIKPFFHLKSNTFCYIVFDKSSNKGAVIDSCLDFDVTTGRTNSEHADLVISYINENNISIEWILETHVHADHLSAAPYIRDNLGGQIGIGSRVKEIQHTFGEIYNAEKGFKTDGSQFDKLFNDGESFYIGEVLSSYISTPGHTPACGCYKIEDNIFVGDTLFMPDGGTARADFPGGDARTLYRSIKKVLNLPGETRLFICHDYGPGGREISWETTVSEQRKNNIHVKDGITEDKYVELREARDSTLSMPKLIIPATQVNMRAGDLPEEENNGVKYLKIPIDNL